MIYLCSQSSKANATTSVFQSRELSGLTIGRMSQINPVGRPKHTQIAFSGYKNNIEAFLYATHMQAKVSTSVGRYPISESYIPTVPFEYPQVAFGLKMTQSAEKIQKMMNSLEREEISQISIGKGPGAFTLKKPAFKTLNTILPNIAKPTIAQLERYSQVESATHMLRVYQCIDLFLRVNTYPYRHSSYSHDDPDVEEGLATIAELRHGGNYFRNGHSAESQKRIKIHREDRSQALEAAEIDRYEKEDLTKTLAYTVRLNHTVFVAKPSRHPSSACWGTPNSIPAIPGLLFPYFDGMLASDSAYVREITTRYFLGNFGTTSVAPIEAAKIFRQTLGTACNTPQGVQLTHILSGIDLALSCQAQLYLLFDAGKYLGYALLGDDFQVLVRGVWYEPVSAEQLATQAAEIATHSGVLDQLATRLQKCTVSGGTPLLSLSLDDISTPMKLAGVLSRVVVDPEENDEEEIGKLIGRLSFPGTLRTPSVDNILWAIAMLTTRISEPLPDDLLFYIPRTSWGGIHSRTYMILASFGSTSISFRNPKGTELRIPRLASESDPFDAKNADGKLVRPHMLLYSRAVKMCVQDWEGVLATGLVRMDFEERAGASRAHRFAGDPLRKIWHALKEGAPLYKTSSIPVVSSFEEAGLTKATGQSFDDFFS